MRRQMAPDIDRLLAEPPAELRDVRDSDMVQGPEYVFVERRMTLLESDLYAVCKQVVLPNEVLFLNQIVERTVIAFRDNHVTKKEPVETGSSFFFAYRACERIKMLFAARSAVSLVIPEFSGAFP